MASQQNAYMEPETSYRPIPGSAFLALLFGLASTSAFASSLFWPVAGLALIYNAYVTSWLERARNEYAGQWIAMFGTLLALAAIVGAPPRYYLTDYIIARESRAIADQYIDALLSGQMLEAYVHTRPVSARTGNPTGIELLARLGGDSYRQFLSNSTVELIKGKGEKAQVTHSGHSEWFHAGGAYMLSHRYDITIPDQAGNPNTLKMSVVMQSGDNPGGDPPRIWQIQQVERFTDDRK